MEKYGSKNLHSLYKTSFLYKLVQFINRFRFGSGNSKSLSQEIDSGSDSDFLNLVDNLPEALISEIIERLTSDSDRNSLYLVSKQLYKIKADQRRSIRVGCELNPLTEAYLTSLCIRYPNLTKIEINYYGYGRNSNFGKQLDDQGLFILSTNCLSLTDLTLSYCSFITDSGLSHLASCKKLVDLSIVKCCSINEHSLVKLGNCLRRLERLEFETDWRNWDRRIHDRLLVGESCFRHQVCCERLKELRLVNCAIAPGNDLYLILRSCSSLEKVCFKMCVGLYDSDITSLSEKSRGLKSIAIDRFSKLTDESFIALGRNCPFLESFEASFMYYAASMDSLVKFESILAVINGCSIRVLVLRCVSFLDDLAMEALSSAPSLETLEIVMANELTDLGIGFVIDFPCLVNLKIRGLQITDDGLIPLIESEKLDYLKIKHCYRISDEGLQGAAKHVCYE